MKLHLILSFFAAIIIFIRPYLRYKSRNENNKESLLSFYYVKRLVGQEKFCLFFYKAEGNQNLIKLHNILTVVLFVLLILIFIIPNFLTK